MELQRVGQVRRRSLRRVAMPGTSPSDERTCDTTTLLRRSLPLSLPPDWSHPLFILLFLRDLQPRLFRVPSYPPVHAIPLFLFFLLLFRLLSSRAPPPSSLPPSSSRLPALSNFSRMFLIMPELVPLWRTHANTSRIEHRVLEHGD